MGEYSTYLSRMRVTVPLYPELQGSCGYHFGISAYLALMARMMRCDIIDIPSAVQRY